MRSLKDIENAIAQAKARTDDEANQSVLNDLLARFTQTDKNQPAEHRPERWRRTMKNPMMKLAIAAVIIVAVVLGLFEFLGSDGASGVVWAQVAEKLETSAGMTARMQNSHTRSGLDSPVQWEAKIYSSPEVGYRMETLQGGKPVSTVICNNARKKMITLMHPLKQYTMRDLSEADLAEIAQKQAGGMDPKVLVEKLLSGGYTELGRETIDGVEAEGVEIQNAPDGPTVQLWIDVETGYPIRMNSQMSISSRNVRIEQVVDEFQWNVELDPNLFELSIPPDYTKAESPKL